MKPLPKPLPIDFPLKAETMRNLLLNYACSQYREVFNRPERDVPSEEEIQAAVRADMENFVTCLMAEELSESDFKLLHGWCVDEFNRLILTALTQRIVNCSWGPLLT